MNAAALGGAAIQGGLGILGSGLNYLFNKRLASQQNQYNIDMWNMQNEYNSPSAQMRRFQDAGLNPNLIYGQGSAGNATQAPQMVTPQAPAVDKQAAEIGKLFNLANLQLIGAQIDKADSEAKSAFQDAVHKGLTNARIQGEIAAIQELGLNYEYNPITGQFTHKPTGINYAYDDYSKGLLKNFMFDLYRKREPLTSIPYRNAYLQAQKNFLVPQTKMRNFDWQNYKTSFFIDRANKGLPGFLYGANEWMKENLGFGF